MSGIKVPGTHDLQVGCQGQLFTLAENRFNQVIIIISTAGIRRLVENKSIDNV
ncbi:MAG: hypothetical protein ABIQ31_14600 [Ferruginibacter sp.]